MGIQVQPCCCGLQFALMTSFNVTGSALLSQDAQPCYLWSVRLPGDRMRSPQRIRWPSLGSEEALRDITGNAFATGIRKHYESGLLYVLGDTGVSGSSLGVPGDNNTVGTRVRLYTIEDRKSPAAIHVGPFGSIGSQDSSTDLLIHASLGPTVARATLPVHSSRRHLVSLDLTTGSVTSLEDIDVAAPSTLIYAIDIHPETDEIWGLHRTTGPTTSLKIGKMTANSMTFTDVVTLSPSLDPALRCGMAFAPGGTMYVASGGGTGNLPWVMYKIKHLDTGVADKVIPLNGNPGSTQFVSGLCLISS